MMPPVQVAGKLGTVAYAFFLGYILGQQFETKRVSGGSEPARHYAARSCAPHS
jgi:hypothetical protein